MLVLDAVLTGANGLNLWASFRGAPPQRRSRLYRALVDAGLAASVGGAFVATVDPFLFVVSVTAAAGQPAMAVEETAIQTLDTVRIAGITSVILDTMVLATRWTSSEDVTASRMSTNVESSLRSRSEC